VCFFFKKNIFGRKGIIDNLKNNLMKRFNPIFALLLLFACVLCSFANAKNNVIKTSFTLTINLADSVKPFKLDSSINNKLFLNSAGSVFRWFGNMDSLLKDIDGDGFDEVYMKNRSGSQYLKMVYHLGSYWNSAGEFEFGYAADFPDSIRVTESDMPVFVTESGIHLGMPLADVIRIKGSGYTKTTISKKETELYYVIKYYDGSVYLRNHKKEMYYARYTFKEGRLTKVKFGFDYF
jgi:hypothetical protein